MDNIEKLIGKKVKELRQSKKMSQPELAKNAKTSLTTINRLENGRQLPQSATLAAIAKALGVSESELMNNRVTKTDGETRSSDRNALILRIQSRLTSLDQDELGFVDGFIDDLEARSARASGSTKNSVAK